MSCVSERLQRLQKAGEYDYFTTTLSLSPLKNAAKLNEIGQRLAKEYGVEYLISDFKKKNGYKRSTELSKFMVCTDRITVVVNFLRDNEK